jgi:tRNA-uridine 2-sulfurtransferase
MKALAVFSGGLDSMLAAELIRVQGIDVLGLFFETPFFHAARARRSAEILHLPLKVLDLAEPHLEVVKKPRYGYGGNMNPCIDCHALMLRKAVERLAEENAQFIITGEVLGQRPMSQNLRALSTVAARSGRPELILRPLSAKLLPLTLPQEKGWVRRDELLALSGRSRKPQMELAGAFNISEYPMPAGGCLLTDPVFSRRLKDLLSARPIVTSVKSSSSRWAGIFVWVPKPRPLLEGTSKKTNIFPPWQAIRIFSSRSNRSPGPWCLSLGKSRGKWKSWL